MIGRQNCFKLCRSHDKDDRLADKWINPLKVLFSGTKWQTWLTLDDLQFFFFFFFTEVSK